MRPETSRGTLNEQGRRKLGCIVWCLSNPGRPVSGVCLSLRWAVGGSASHLLHGGAGLTRCRPPRPRAFTEATGHGHPVGIVCRPVVAHCPKASKGLIQPLMRSSGQWPFVRPPWGARISCQGCSGGWSPWSLEPSDAAPALPQARREGLFPVRPMDPLAPPLLTRLNVCPASEETQLEGLAPFSQA